MEEPNVPRDLAAGALALDFDPDSISYFLGRETLLATPTAGMYMWRESLFSFMSRNSQPATLFFRRIRMGGVSVGDYSAEHAQAIWQQIVGRLEAIGQRPQIDIIVPFEHVKDGFARLAQGPMGKVLVQVARQVG